MVPRSLTAAAANEPLHRGHSIAPAARHPHPQTVWLVRGGRPGAAPLEAGCATNVDRLTVSDNLPLVATYGDVLEALADPTRRTVLELVAERPRAVVDLARQLPISRPAVSQHLRVLKDAGLVCATPEGTRRIYRLNPQGVVAARAYLDRFWDEALAGFAAAVEESEERSDEHETGE